MGKRRLDSSGSPYGQLAGFNQHDGETSDSTLQGNFFTS